MQNKTDIPNDAYILENRPISENSDIYTYGITKKMLSVGRQIAFRWTF